MKEKVGSGGKGWEGVGRKGGREWVRRRGKGERGGKVWEKVGSRGNGVEGVGRVRRGSGGNGVQVWERMGRSGK